jgi:hypothetical protein
MHRKKPIFGADGLFHGHALKKKQIPCYHGPDLFFKQCAGAKAQYE